MPLLHIRDANGVIQIEAQAGQKLSHAIWLSGKTRPRSLCDGLGACLKCKCRFLSVAPEPTETEKRHLNAQQLAEGWRLACQHHVLANARLEIPGQLTEPPDSPQPQQAAAIRGWLGIDLGTTTIAWRVEDEKGHELARGSFLNPQGGAGADIISRLRHVLQNGADDLARLTLDSINKIARGLQQGGIHVEKMCVAANSAQTEILLRKDVTGLAAAPYHLSFTGNEWLNLPTEAGEIETYFPPLIAPFIGGDISAGVASLLQVERPFVLADLGTNAEFALLDKAGDLTIISAPLGPALEGIGPENGSLATIGAITGFNFGPAGLEPLFYNNQPAQNPSGISATGYIALVSILYKLGVINVNGQFAPDPCMPLARKIAAQINGSALGLPYGLKLSLQDMELLLKVKATFQLAVSRLLETAGIVPAYLKAFYLAGALGEFINYEDLLALGFLPRSLQGKIVIAGNTSLRGACLLARQSSLIQSLTRICSTAVCIQMTDEPDFMERYLSCMRWG